MVGHIQICGYGYNCCKVVTKEVLCVNTWWSGDPVVAIAAAIISDMAHRIKAEKQDSPHCLRKLVIPHGCTNSVHVPPENWTLAELKQRTAHQSSVPEKNIGGFSKHDSRKQIEVTRTMIKGVTQPRCVCSMCPSIPRACFYHRFRIK